MKISGGDNRRLNILFINVFLEGNCMLFLQRSTMNIKGTAELLKAEFCDLFNSVECSFLYKQLNSDKT